MASKTGREYDPLVGFNFRLEIEGKLSGYFTEVGGIGSENEIVEQKAVDKKGHEIILKVPGRLKWENVTLKRGITDKMDIWDWRKLVEDGKMKDARTNCSVIMMDRNYEDVARWDLTNAWPSKVTGPSIKSDSNEFGIEEVTLVHEGMIRKS
jgi:phage tail-like protein